ncbi:MAG: GNAT family N-acetyltransferase [Armatimonadia bacterium]|nr:GNAT family N-acetyltransferase [Armatimonadia bacterium]
MNSDSAIEERVPMGYVLSDFAEVPDLTEQVTRLQNLAFAEYEGAMEIDEAFMAWYLSRPGTDLRMCQAALADDDRLVSQVIVCAQDVQIGGVALRCGIIDSVATDPEDRKQGLARSLMERAHEIMQRVGLDAAVLYTNPDDHPYHFYSRLGYQERARASMLLGARPGESGCGAQQIDPAEEAEGLRALLNDYYVGHEGFAPLGEELWKWHKIDAPSDPTVVAEMTGSGPISTATFADAPVRIEGEEHEVSMAYDVAAQVMNEDEFGSLLSVAPREMVGLILAENAPERRWADALGFEPRVSEVSMVLPFSREARSALRDHGGPWYVMIESVVGV